MMDWVDIKSSNIDKVKYDDRNNTLYVLFDEESKYAYYGVPELQYKRLVNAPSKGDYLHQNIEDKYLHERIN